VPASGPGWAEITTAISTALLVVISGFAFWVGLLGSGRYRPIKVTPTLGDGRLDDDRWLQVPEDMPPHQVRLALVNIYNKSDHPQTIHLVPEQSQLRKANHRIHPLLQNPIKLEPYAAATWQIGFGPADWPPPDDDYKLTLKIRTGSAKTVTWRRARRVEALAYPW
jgi:hypothetical protein